MLQRLTDLPEGLEGVKAIGEVTTADYERVVEPLIDEARRTGRKIRFLYEFGPSFDGFTPGAAWEDAKIGLHSMRLFDGCAIVSDVGWIRAASRVAAFMMPCPVRVFDNAERGGAIEWLHALPESTTKHRLLPEAGVIVVEVGAPLNGRDFESLALTADSWIESHGDLRGIVIHAREFPGWENLDGLVKHLRFVHDHHRKVKSIALAVDGKLAKLAPHVAEHFVEAEVKAFSYDELEGAIAWARGAAVPA